MNLKDLTKPLDIKDIDFRIQSINKGGYATILAYKDARVDMNRLDEVVGAGYWKREHSDNNANCKVSIYNTDIKEWIVKEDVGTKSFTEAEKGLASDSFKRACFNWGIGRELYDFPVIKLKLNDNEFELYDTKQKDYAQKPIMKARATFGLKLKEWKWSTKINEIGEICLACKDETGKLRFNYGFTK